MNATISRLASSADSHNVRLSGKTSGRPIVRTPVSAGSHGWHAVEEYVADVLEALVNEDMFLEATRFLQEVGNGWRFQEQADSRCTDSV
ncbi:MAG: hypothetical protein OEY86_03140 [Nitrospira sp.]|nr:hypothetical protein [Nitrospira sp.]